MRLLYITSSLPHGPTEAFIITEVQELLRQGHEVFIAPVHPRGPIIHLEAPELLSRSFVQPILSKSIFFGALKTFFGSAGSGLKTLYLGVSARPKILLKNLSVFPKALWLADMVKKYQIEHIHAHWAGTTASVGMMVSEMTGVPWSFTAHRWDIVENNLLQRKINHAMFSRFIAQRGLKLAESLGLKSAGKSFVLHMGVRLPPQTEQRRQHRTMFRLLCPANLVEVKGHRYLLEAMALLSNTTIELWLAGDGILRKELEDISRGLSLCQQVKFLGALPHSKLLELYAQGEVDAVVLPSIDLGNGLHEGIPVSLMEAMAYGIPVISTHTGSIPELVAPGTGVLVEQKKPEDLARAIVELSSDSDFRRLIASNGQQRVLQNFEVGWISSKLVAAMQS